MRLNVTTTSGCRGSCVYCPQDEYRDAARDQPTYLTASELRAFAAAFTQRLDELSFGGFSEPLDNPDIVELLEIASTLADRISIHTIGDRATPDLIDRMSHIAIDRFDLSCHGFDPRVYQRTRPFVDPQVVHANLLYLLEHRANIRKLVVSLTGPFGTDEARDELAALCARHGAYLDVRALNSRAGLLKIARRERSPRGFQCRKHDFGKPVLVPGGDLLLCCQDFAMRQRLGNLHDGSFADVLERSPVRQHVIAVAEGREVDPSLSCYQCEFCEPWPVGD